MRCIVTNVCWGASFTQIFHEFALPATLAPNNLPYMAAHGDVLYRLYTTPIDHAALKETASFQLLLNTVKVDVRYIPHIGGPHVTMAQCHRETIVEFADGENRLVFLAPDTIFSEGTMKRIVQSAENGFRVLAIGGTQTFHFGEFLNSQKPVSASWAANSRAMTAWAVKYGNDYTDDNLWRTDGVADFPAIPFWKVGNEGMICHLLLPHPIMVWPRKGSEVPRGTIDWYIPMVCQNASECDIGLNADEMNYIGPRPQPVKPFHACIDPIAYTKQFVKCFDPILREIYKRSVRLPITDMHEELWGPVEREANSIIERVCA